MFTKPSANKRSDFPHSILRLIGFQTDWLWSSRDKEADDKNCYCVQQYLPLPSDFVLNHINICHLKNPKAQIKKPEKEAVHIFCVRSNIFNSELRQSTHLEGGGGSWLRQKCSFECRRSFCTSAQLALMHFLHVVRGMQHLWGAIVFRLCCNLLRLYCVVFHLRPGGRCWGQKWAEVAS